MKTQEIAQQLNIQESEVKGLLKTLGLEESEINNETIGLLQEHLETLKGGQVEKPKKPGAITKIDNNNLPAVSTLTNAQVDGYIAQIEAMDAEGQTVSDETLQFLMDLYNRRQEFLTFYEGIQTALKAQDMQAASLQAELGQTIEQSIQSLQDFSQFSAQLGQGGARISDNFRAGTERIKSAHQRFMEHVAASSNQSNSTTESAA